LGCNGAKRALGSSFIRTLTVGFGFSPNLSFCKDWRAHRYQPHHRRCGIAPPPEERYGIASILSHISAKVKHKMDFAQKKFYA
jgi:hypothetical protein